MTIPVELIVMVFAAIGTALVGLLSLVVHATMLIVRKLDAIGVTMAGIDKRNALEDERHATLARNVTDIQARLDRQGVLA